MNIGLDIHGVIDRYPEEFAKMSHEWHKKGYVIHILTGQERELAEPTVKEAGIHYDHFYSIVDHHKGMETPMYERTDKQGWWMDRETWLRSKGDYAKWAIINCHFDDSIEYAPYFPLYCTFVKVNRFGLDLFREMMK